jgi:hypothetical protein
MNDILVYVVHGVYYLRLALGVYNIYPKEGPPVITVDYSRECNPNEV